jgi:hypothetical protein
MNKPKGPVVKVSAQISSGYSLKIIANEVVNFSNEKDSFNLYGPRERSLKVQTPILTAFSPSSEFQQQ